ncbi:hypothetical protein FOZ62_009686, partial [Perkinsus olseni]
TRVLFKIVGDDVVCTYCMKVLQAASIQASRARGKMGASEVGNASLVDPCKIRNGLDYSVVRFHHTASPLELAGMAERMARYPNPLTGPSSPFDDPSIMQALPGGSPKYPYVGPRIHPEFDFAVGMPPSLPPLWASSSSAVLATAVAAGPLAPRDCSSERIECFL